MDERSFDEFYENSFRRLVGQTYAMCGNLAEAQDCVQEASSAPGTSGAAWTSTGSPEAWVRTVAYRLAVSRWRKARKALRAPDRAYAAQPPREPDVSRVALARALQQLPTDQRRAIVLHHLCDLSVAEIAVETNVPVGTVKARLSRGRAALAALLTDRFPRSTFMDEHDPLDLELRALADEAERHSTTPPDAASLRRLGNRRRRRRMTAIAVTAVAALVVGGGAVISADPAEDRPAALAGGSAQRQQHAASLAHAVAHADRDSATPFERHSGAHLRTRFDAHHGSGTDPHDDHLEPSPDTDAQPHPDADRQRDSDP